MVLEAGGGAIVHMSSVCAITVWAGDCAYDISLPVPLDLPGATITVTQPDTGFTRSIVSTFCCAVVP